MANEATVTAVLQIINGNWQRRTSPQSFTANVAGQNGPTPGSLLISGGGRGTQIPLTGLTALGGLCWIRNDDLNNSVDVGLFDNNTDTFYPLILLLPGEFYPLRLSTSLTHEELGTGTGQVGSVSLWAKALPPTVGSGVGPTGSARITVEAFDP
jgi:hypothetical protein